MRKLKWVGIAAVALFAALCVLTIGSSHGHIDEPLVVTVRITDAETGRPLEGALVATVRHGAALERDTFEARVRQAAELEGDEFAWQFPVVVARSAAAETTAFRSAAYVTRHWIGPIRVRKTAHPPDLLLIDHPRLGRTVVPIDPKLLREGEEERTWRLDLGTVAVPR